jgi:murein DD-endopeptidase MepM/ murein hydrolase activator NlpD
MKIDEIALSTIEKEKTKRNSAIRKACKDFESIFTYELLKSMRRTIEKCDLFHGGQAEEIYESMLDQELAKNIAGNGSSSISELLYQQLKEPNSIESEGEGFSAQYAAVNSKLPGWPVKAPGVSSGFGWRKDPFTGRKQFHKGIDIPAEEGTKVKAAMSGRVLFSDNQKGYGKVVVIDHGHGFTTLYAHNRENNVRKGDWIEQGETIAEVGSTGRSTGPHLHFEVRRDGKHLDPVKFLGA